jgi:hypothetical protein
MFQLYRPNWKKSSDEYVVWTGKWKSSIVPTQAYGTIKIPFKKINVGEYKTKVTLTYEGCYKGGTEISFWVGVISSEIELMNKQKVMYLEFTGQIEGQRVEYTVTEYSKDKIKGLYKSYNPEDEGSIELILNHNI